MFCVGCTDAGTSPVPSYLMQSSRLSIYVVEELDQDDVLLEG